MTARKTKLKRCDFCNRSKLGVMREHLFENEDDAVFGYRGFYRNLCRKCERDKVSHP